MSVLSPMGEAEFCGISKARFYPVNELRDEGEGLNCLWANALSGQEALEVTRPLFMCPLQDLHQPSGCAIPQDDIVFPRKLQAPKPLNLRPHPVGMSRGDLGARLPGPLTFPGNHVEDLAAVIAADCRVGFTYETIQLVARPMVPAGVTRMFIHSLLHNAPRSILGKEEAVVIELIAVLKGCTVDLGRHFARIHEAFRLYGKSITKLLDLVGRFPRYPSLPPSNEETGIPLRPQQPFFERPTDGGGQAAAMPIESQHAAEGLKPEGIGEPPQHLQGTELIDDYQAYLPRQLLHPLEKPGGCPSVMKGKVGRARPHCLSPTILELTSLQLEYWNNGILE